MKTTGDKISKSFCILPWIHLNVNPDGLVKPCCVTDHSSHIGDLKDSTLEELWNSETMLELRRDKLSGTRNKLCSKCFQQEDHGGVSTRQTMNQNFSSHIDDVKKYTTSDGYNSKFSLKYFDIRFSNLCNFKCRTCGLGYSSKWYDDTVALFGETANTKSLFHVDDVSKVKVRSYIDKYIDQVEEIYFAGGEPLIMDEHYYILKKLTDLKKFDVRLRYNTNLSKLKFKKWDCVKLWKPFLQQDSSKLELHASFDGIGKAAEYARSGTEWNIIESNITRCLENSIPLFVSTTVSILNIFEITKMVDRFLQLGIPFYRIGLYNVLTYPEHYKINILPKELKKSAISELTNHLNSMGSNMVNHFKPQYDTIISFMKSDSDDKAEKELLRVTEILDKNRKESFTDTYPYYSKWYKNISNRNYE